MGKFIMLKDDEWILEQKRFCVAVFWDWPDGLFETEPRCGCIEIEKLSDIPETFGDFMEVWGDDFLNDLSTSDLKKALEINAKVIHISEI